MVMINIHGVHLFVNSCGNQYAIHKKPKNLNQFPPTQNVALVSLGVSWVQEKGRSRSNLQKRGIRSSWACEKPSSVTQMGAAS